MLLNMQRINTLEVSARNGQAWIKLALHTFSRFCWLAVNHTLFQRAFCSRTGSNGGRIGGSKKRRPRAYHSQAQVYELERRFAVQTYLTTHEREQMAGMLNLKETQVKNLVPESKVQEQVLATGAS